MNESSLIGYIQTPNDFSRIIRERGDIFEKIMFSPAQLEQMEKDAPQDFALVREWLVACVGIRQLILTLVIRNAGTEPLTLTSVIYEVVAVGMIAGGKTGPVYPEKTYDHSLKHEIGEQLFQLKPPLQVGAGDVVSFNLRLFSAERGLGLVWLLKVKTIAATGDVVSSEPVQIIMSKSWLMSGRESFFVATFIRKRTAEAKKATYGTLQSLRWSNVQR